MTRIVVDSNVLVSAALKASSLPRIAVSWIDRHATLLKSVVTEEEILLVLQRPRLAKITAALSGKNHGCVLSRRSREDAGESRTGDNLHDDKFL
jgi:predicted nucleic acid-binding protein